MSPTSEFQEPYNPDQVSEEMSELETISNMDIEQLRDDYQNILKKRAELVFKNAHLQNKLCDYFKRKKTTESQSLLKGENKPHEEDAGDAVNETTQEQRYARYLTKLKQNQTDLVAFQKDSKKSVSETKKQKTTSEAEVQNLWQKLVETYKTIASQAISSRTGKPLPGNAVDKHIENLEKKEEEVSVHRLENIKMTNKLKKKEFALKQKEELADGLHLIDFEQLKIENQTYNEKIEERNEELMKLHQKITSTVQVLTHYKEKLQFMEHDSTMRMNKLKTIEVEVVQCRDSLAKCKQQRDALKSEFFKIEQNAGLLGSIGATSNDNKKSKILLKDFQERQDETIKLEQDIENFRKRHAELSLDIKVFENKVEKVKQIGVSINEDNRDNRQDVGVNNTGILA